MGLIWNAKLTGWRRAALADLWRSQNPDDAGPIGVKNVRPDRHTATEIVLDRNERLIYGSEVPIEVYKDDVVLPAAIAEFAGVAMYPNWLFQMRGKEIAAKRKKSIVVLAKFPPAKNYVVTGELKPTAKDQKRGFQNHLIPALANEDLRTQPADVRLAKAISRLKYTPFTNAYPAVAAWGLPKVSSPLIGAERRDGDDNYVVGLLTMPLQVTIEAVKRDPILERSLERTESGSLFRYARNDGGAKRGPVPKQVLKNVVDRRHEILEFAILVSLGGFINPDRMKGEPVARWAAMIYYRFAYSMQSRIEDRKGRTLCYLPLFARTGEPVDSKDAWFSRVETDETLYKVLSGPDEKAAKAVRDLLDRQQPEDLQELLDTIRRIAGSRPAVWVKELLREYT